MTIKPKRLKEGDRVAIVSPSRTLPSIFPILTQLGIENLKKYFNLDPVTFPMTFSDLDLSYKHPEMRAKDLNDAFYSEDIRGIISTIGGDESIRILRFLDSSRIQSNPKIFCGFSDCTTITSFLWSRGMASIYGGAVMAGFAQMDKFPEEFTEYWKSILFRDSSGLVMKRFKFFSEGYPDWRTTEDFSVINEMRQSYAWNWINGESMSGRVFAANLEVLDWLRGTPYFPSFDTTERTILLLETSEEVPSPVLVERILRAFGVLGILGKISGLGFGKFRGYSKEMISDVRFRIKNVVQIEFGLDQLPIVDGIDFGHTDPYFPVPVGINCLVEKNQIQLLETFSV